MTRKRRGWQCAGYCVVWPGLSVPMCRDFDFTGWRERWMESGPRWKAQQPETLLTNGAPLAGFIMTLAIFMMNQERESWRLSTAMHVERYIWQDIGPRLTPRGNCQDSPQQMESNCCPPRLV